MQRLDDIKRVVWRAQKSLNEPISRGEICLEGRLYSVIKNQFSTQRKVMSPSGERGYKNTYFQKTFIYFYGEEKKIVIESPSERAIHSWAYELGLKLHS